MPPSQHVFIETRCVCRGVLGAGVADVDPSLSELTRTNVWVWGVGPPRWEPQGLEPQAWLPLGAYHASLGLCADRDPCLCPPSLSLTPRRMEPGPSSRLQPSKLLASGNRPQASPCARAGGQGRGGAGRGWGLPARSSGCCPVWPRHAPRGPGPAAGTERAGTGPGLAGGPTARDGARRPPVSLSPLTPA